MNKFVSFLSLSLLISPIANADEMRPTGDLGVVIERVAQKEKEKSPQPIARIHAGKPPE